MKTRHKISYSTFDNQHVIDMTKGGYLYAEHSLFSGRWRTEATLVRGRFNASIIERYKEPISETVKLQIHDRDRARFNDLIDELQAAVNYDMIAEKLGVLTVNGWSLDCNIVAVHAGRQNLINLQSFELSVYAPSALWYKASKTSWASVASSTSLIGKKYARKFAERYGGANSLELSVSGTVPAAFIVRFFGPCENPSISIGGHVYGVNESCNEGESITLDTLNRAVYKTLATGEIINVFGKRLRTGDQFAPLTQGVFTVIRAGDYPIDFTLFERRTEPPQEVR